MIDRVKGQVSSVKVAGSNHGISIRNTQEDDELVFLLKPHQAKILINLLEAAIIQAEYRK